MSAREEILTKLRASRDPRVALPALLAPMEGRPDHVAQFVERAADVGIQVISESAPTWAAAAVSELRRRTVRSVALWADPVTMPLADALQSIGIEVVLPDRHTGARLDHCEAGVTTADAAIALSGTLLLAADARRPRTTSLLPPLHMAVLPGARIVPTLAHLFARVARPLPSALTFITGPSRSADIELIPVKGAHGPVEVIVYLIM